MEFERVEKLIKKDGDIVLDTIEKGDKVRITVNTLPSPNNTVDGYVHSLKKDYMKLSRTRKAVSSDVLMTVKYKTIVDIDKLDYVQLTPSSKEEGLMWTR